MALTSLYLTLRSGSNNMLHVLRLKWQQLGEQHRLPERKDLN